MRNGYGAGGLFLRILLIRGQRVLLGSDLAQLYGVEAKKFNQRIKRNPARFPPDFMFDRTERGQASLLLILHNALIYIEYLSIFAICK
ncbi:MAG: ORF6N domain-containing protein [Polaromonas sp.]